MQSCANYPMSLKELAKTIHRLCGVICTVVLQAHG